MKPVESLPRPPARSSVLPQGHGGVGLTSTPSAAEPLCGYVRSKFTGNLVEELGLGISGGGASHHLGIMVLPTIVAYHQ